LSWTWRPTSSGAEPRLRQGRPMLRSPTR
jgi:hypothetical protein